MQTLKCNRCGVEEVSEVPFNKKFSSQFKMPLYIPHGMDLCNDCHEVYSKLCDKLLVESIQKIDDYKKQWCKGEASADFKVEITDGSD